MLAWRKHPAEKETATALTQDTYVTVKGVGDYVCVRMFLANYWCGFLPQKLCQHNVLFRLQMPLLALQSFVVPLPSSLTGSVPPSHVWLSSFYPMLICTAWSIHLFPVIGICRISSECGIAFYLILVNVILDIFQQPLPLLYIGMGAALHRLYTIDKLSFHSQPVRSSGIRYTLQQHSTLYLLCCGASDLN